MLTALVIAGAVFFAVIIIGLNPVLEIRDSNSGKRYGSWQFEEEKEFSVEFIHSVNKSPVRETFTIEKDMIRLKSLRFYSYGAGIPSYLDEGQTMTRDGDALLITGFTSSFKKISYIIGPYSDHLLIINNDIISLRELTGLNSNTGGRNANITIQLK